MGNKVGKLRTILYEIHLDEGKYRLIYYTCGDCEAFRYGVPWPAFEGAMQGSKVIMSMVARIYELEHPK